MSLLAGYIGFLLYLIVWMFVMAYEKAIPPTYQWFGDQWEDLFGISDRSMNCAVASSILLFAVLPAVCVGHIVYTIVSIQSL